MPSEESAEFAESLLALVLEEKREKVRKLRLANDEKEKLLVSEKPTHTYYCALLRATTEDLQNWTDPFGPNLAAKYNIDQRSLTQDLRDGVRVYIQRYRRSTPCSGGPRFTAFPVRGRGLPSLVPWPAARN